MFSKNGENIGFDRLPDEVIMHILSYADASSLYNLNGLNSRLDSLVSSRQLWRYVDGRTRGPPNRSRKLATFCKSHIHSGTRTLLLAARSRFKRLFHLNWLLNQPDYNTLTVLALENQRFTNNIALKLFPRGLRELSLRNTYSDADEAFFKHSDEAMAELRVLVLDGCRWVRSWVLMPVSKYRKLQVLSMVRCTKALDQDVYVSMSASFGFQHLRICDVRHTMFANSLVSTMALHKSQMHSLYFSSYSAAFYPDVIALMQQQMKQQQQRAGGMECVREEMDFDERKMSVCRKLLGDMGVERGFTCSVAAYQDITDEAGRSFMRLRDEVDADADDIEDLAVYQSILYNDPYSQPCQCKYKERGELSLEVVQDPMPEWPVCNFNPVKAQTRSQEATPQDNVKTSDNMKHRRRRRMFEMATVSYGYHYSRDVSSGGADSTEPKIEEEPGDEYEACCQAYKAHNHITHISNNSAVQQRKRKRRASSSSGSDGKDSEPSDCSSSDSESDGDDVPPRCRSRPAKKPRLRPMVSPHGGAQFSCDIDDPCMHPELFLNYQEPIPDDELYRIIAINNQQPVDHFGVEVIPAHELNESVPSRLTHLSLRGYKKITDSTLKSLAHLHNIRLLDVTGTNVTVAGLHSYISTHPQVRVVHQSACTCIPIIHL